MIKINSKSIPFENSFASHSKSIYWSNKNEGLPCEYALNSHKKCWFDCECGHEFQIALNNINLLNRWCSYCANKKLCNKELNCLLCFNKSFASINYSANWSEKNIITPSEILKYSHKKYLFKCPLCKHSFQEILSHISRGNHCPYCANKKLCNKELNCDYCLNKTFASIDKSFYWSNKNEQKPFEVFKSTATKFWFDCDKCFNDFESKLCHVTSGSWCPHCRYKTEDKFNNILIKKIPSLKTQYKFDWCKNVKHLPFDFVIEEKRIIIELDGLQHLKQVSKWKSPEYNKKRDLYKMKCANENGYSIIRILQEDVWHNKYDWLDELIYNINKIVLDKKVQNIYMCKKDEYKDFTPLDI